MDAIYKTTLTPNTIEYPAILRDCADIENPPVITVHGNLNLLDGRLLGFFCSQRCPGDTILKIYDLARALRCADVTLMGGFQSAMEIEFPDLILRGSARVIICPARGLGTKRIPANLRKPLVDGRLLLLSFFNDNMRRPASTVCNRRNAHIVALADSLLIAHAERGGKTEKLCKDSLNQGKPVFDLASQDNGHLVELGAAPFKADDPMHLLQSIVVDYSSLLT